MNALWFVILYVQELNRCLNLDGIVFSLKKQMDNLDYSIACHLKPRWHKVV